MHVIRHFRREPNRGTDRALHPPEGERRAAGRRNAARRADPSREDKEARPDVERRSGKKVKKTWIMPTARAKYLDPHTPLARPPVEPGKPWIPNLEIPEPFPAYRDDT
jgi:hypothetical protein